MDRSAHRIVDAAGNRVAEALRTLEDVARFVIDDADACQRLKGLRHRVNEALGGFDRGVRLRSRDTPGDVGTSITTAAESRRTTTADVVAAAAGRLTESLRSLEECAKVLRPEAASSFESARYESYAVAAALELAVIGDRRVRLANAKIYVLLGTADRPEGTAERVAALADAGVDIVQLRDKAVDDGTLYRHGRAFVAAARAGGVLSIINDRADIAAAVDADGVHVGQEELPAAAVRGVVGPDRLVGLSTHDLDQVRDAAGRPVDYIGCGPVFPSSTKSFDRHTGPDWLSDVADIFAGPAFAIGGVDLTNVGAVAGRGMNRVAVTALAEVDDGLRERMRTLRGHLSELATPDPAA